MLIISIPCSIFLRHANARCKHTNTQDGEADDDDKDDHEEDQDDGRDETPWYVVVVKFFQR